MIKFLIKGILRDKSRSLLPIAVISIGVMLTVLLSGYMRGVMGDIIDQNARFETGHVKIMTKAYAENKDQIPNDLAILEVDELMAKIQQNFPDLKLTQRIKFGGLIDVPDENGNTKGQGPTSGMAIDMFENKSGELERLNIESSLVTGNLPTKSGEIIIGHDFSEKLNIQVGDEVTFVGSTMNGSMTFQNLTVSGTIRFGTSAMDKGALIMDITDAQRILDMENATGEILGYLPDEVYYDNKAEAMANRFNEIFKDDTDEYAPIMQKLKDQNNLTGYLDMMDSYSGIFVGIFIFAMSIVLWNTGLLGGLRRYQEYGIRLALGEAKGHIYRSLIIEAVIIGIVGSVVGTIIGLALTYYMQVVGIDISDMLDDATMMMPSVLRSKITPDLLYIGFIPGLIAMTIGNMLSGIGIYKRETAQLFKELEV